MFGFLFEELGDLHLDLLGNRTALSKTPVQLASTLAAAKFQDQINKARLDSSRIRSAQLSVSKVAAPAHSVSKGGAHKARAHHVRSLPRASCTSKRVIHDD